MWSTDAVGLVDDAGRAVVYVCFWLVLCFWRLVKEGVREVVYDLWTAAVQGLRVHIE